MSTHERSSIYVIGIHDPGYLESQGHLNLIISAGSPNICHFGVNLGIGSEDKSANKAFYMELYYPGDLEN